MPARRRSRVAVAVTVRVMALLAYVLMPLAVGSGSAAAATQEQSVISPCEGHQQPSKDELPTQKQHCASCIALPMLDDTPAQITKISRVLVAINLPSQLIGKELEVATPPPKFA
jgi:hypothetical protein